MQKDFKSWHHKKKQLDAVVRRPFFHEREIFWAIPITRSNKKTKHYVSFVLGGMSSSAIISQVRLIDASRLSHRLGEISVLDFQIVLKKFKAPVP